jgi:formate hydrogenlyase subunit 6/NADH:ubiquinone oxidoreductase subunit I
MKFKPYFFKEAKKNCEELILNNGDCLECNFCCEVCPVCDDLSDCGTNEEVLEKAKRWLKEGI